MQRYVKGARNERELLNMFVKSKYSVMRAAGSGVNSLSPDIIAIKGNSMFAFECKAWNRGSIAIDIKRYESLLEWQKNTNMDTMIAWKTNGGTWKFIRLSDMSKKEKNYTITKKEAAEKGLTMERLIFHQD
ncbi:MAG: Holliday junction resolvase Hjc [Candidatus Micrarchaeaceae archaeon]